MNVQIIDFEKVLADSSKRYSPELWLVERQEILQERDSLLKIYPFSIILALCYPQIDFADRWCNQQFGFSNGECHDSYSEYQICQLDAPHCHLGVWRTKWWEKVGYDYSYNEYFFENKSDFDKFITFLPQICFGENYPSDADANWLAYLEKHHNENP